MKNLLWMAIFVSRCTRAFAGADSVYVQITGDTVKVWNANAVLNCCSGVIMINTTLSNDSITIVEHDTSRDICNCMCHFDLCDTLTGLPAGSYAIVVYRQYRYSKPDSLFFIGSTSFSFGGNGSGLLKSAGYKSPCLHEVQVDNGKVILPEQVSLSQNYPNPFNPQTSISFSLPTRSYVKITVFTAIGKEIATLMNQEQEAGNHSITWEPDISSGIYFCRIQAINSINPAETFMQVRKMVLMK